MANGSSKHGYAKADRFREQRAETQKKAKDAIRRFRDSIADDDETPRQLIVNVSPAAPPSRRSISDSLRPLVEKVRTARRGVKIFAVVVAVMVPAVLEALRQIGALK